MKVRVNIDVMNFQTRAFLVPHDAEPLPGFSGFIQVMSGAPAPSYINWEKAGECFSIDLYPYLSETEQEKIDKIVNRTGGPGMSGWRGSIIVNISDKKLQQALQEKEVEK